MILFAIPLIGWLACLITAFAAGNKNKRNFARATLFFMIIGLIFLACAYFMFSWIFEVLVEYAQSYAGEELPGLFEILSGGLQK
jgi:Na+/phosphate symporter